MLTKALGFAIGILTTSLLTACNGHAEPPTFPDLSGYTPVDIADYQIAFDNPGRQPTRTDYFLSPDGVVCVVESGGAACLGNNLPGVSSVANPQTSVHYMDTQKGLYESANPRYIVNNIIHNQPIKTLPPFHSITVDGAVCGVDDKKTTACKDPQGRGFILSPSWSGWLEHVS